MSAPPVSPLRARVLTAFAAFTAIGAVALGAVAVVDAVDERVALDVTPAVASETPTTIAPRADTSTVDRSTESVATTDRSTGPDVRSDRDEDVSTGADEADPGDRPPDDDAPPTSVSSPLADQLGPRGSAIPPAVAARAVPTGLQISSIDVSGYPVRAIGLEPDGQLEVPDETEIGWYRYGAAPGHAGATVLAAHVSWNRTTGPFALLGTVEPGDQVEVALGDGTFRHYEVVERAVYGKLELPRERLWTNSGPESLVLITCGGEFDPDARRYAENIVVYAVPIG